MAVDKVKKAARRAARRIRKAFDSHKGEWLTRDIAKEYYNRACCLPPNGNQDIGEWRKLRIELQERCGVTEIEANNIIRGFYWTEYVNKYDRIRNVEPTKSELENVNGKKELIHDWFYRVDLMKKQPDETIEEYKRECW